MIFDTRWPHISKKVLALRKNIREMRLALAGESSSPRQRGRKGFAPGPMFRVVNKLRSQAMINLKQAVAEFIREEEGLTVVEYAIAGGLIGLAVITAFQALGGTVASIIQAINDLLAENIPAGE
ncbi:Flp family type IVb pilin [Peristeroidobacter agariperforans]|uniref:Flp family type IVb pilin n=1 Tax=Peristeroidobacter agariperforans TaxID=268404 RepID=UPI0018E5838C|nr:Flp family type IVb pilin [Peristeroidobacter agariperforans]